MRLVFIKEGRSIYGAERATLTLLSALNQRSDVELCVLLREYTKYPSPFLVALIHREIPFITSNSDWEWRKRIVETCSSSSDILALIAVGYKSQLILGSVPFLKLPKVAILHGWVSTDWKLITYNLLTHLILFSYRGIIRVADTVFSLHPRVVTIPNAIEAQTIQSLSQEPIPENLRTILQTVSRPLFLFLGRLSPEKGILPLLEGFRQYVRDHSGTLLCIGEGELLEQIQTFILVHCMGGQIFLSGHLENPYPIIKQSDLVVLPSLSEACPLTILESMILKVPVAGTPVGSIPNLIGDNERGWLISRPQATAIKEIFINFQCTPEEERWRRIESAYHYVHQFTSPQEVAARFLDVLIKWTKER